MKAWRYVLCIVGGVVAGAALAQQPLTAVNSADELKLQALTRLQEMSMQPTVERLVQYAAQGDLAVVKNLLAAGVPINAGNAAHQTTALYNAAAQGHLKLVEWLIQQHAEVNQADAHGVTPLTAACFYGHIEVARLLLDKGAELPPRPHAWTFPLLAAVQADNTELVALLLAKGASWQAATAEGLTAAQAAKLSQRSAALLSLIPVQAVQP